MGIIAAANDVNGTNYTFNDPEKTVSMAYYRLKLISQSGNGYQYSKIIILYNKNALLKVSALNPFKNNLNLNIFLPEEGNVDFILFDTFGKTVDRKSMHLNKGNCQVILDSGEHLPVGVYFLRTVFNNTVVQNKLFKTE